MSQNNDTVFVDSVKNITLTNGQTRRVQYVHNAKMGLDLAFNGRVIKNIGNANYLFSYIASAMPPDGGPIRCYYENSIIVQSELQPCDFQTSIIENNIEQDIKLIQNPIVNNISIQIINDLLLPVKTITIYNTLGKVIFQENNITNNNIIIDFSDKSNGFYLVKIILKDNQVIIKKIVKPTIL